MHDLVVEDVLDYGWLDLSVVHAHGLLTAVGSLLLLLLSECAHNVDVYVRNNDSCLTRSM